MLTQKQENFTLNIFKGQTEHDAWGNAGYSTNYSRDVIYVNACRLANSTKIQLRLVELRQGSANKAVATVQERMERLTEFIREDTISDKGTKIRKDNISATTELNKMDGSYAPEKIDIREILITADMRTLAAKEMLEIKEEEDKLMEGNDAIQRPSDAKESS